MHRAAVSEAADLAFEPPRRYQIFDNSIFSGVSGRGFPPVLGTGLREFDSHHSDHSEVAKLVRHLTVTQAMCGFESHPQSHAGVAFWLRALLLRRSAVEFDPLPRHQFCPGEAHMDERAIDNREALSSNLRPWTRAPLAYRKGRRSSKAVEAGSTPAGCSSFSRLSSSLGRAARS